MDDLLDAKGQPLNLREPAASAARALKAKFPGVVFTSGKRDLRAQAQAMAKNAVLPGGGTKYLLTYKPSRARDEMIAWWKSHSKLVSWSPVAQGFLSILMRLPPDEAAKISRHLGGLAFDIRPVDGDEGAAIREAIAELPHLDKFLDHEGGLTRFHLQFDSLPEVPA